MFHLATPIIEVSYLERFVTDPVTAAQTNKEVDLWIPHWVYFDNDSSLQLIQRVYS